MALETISGYLEKGVETAIPEKVTIYVKTIDDINKVYSMVKDDKNFILEKDGEAVLVVANPLSSKLENGELEIVAQK